MGTVIVLTSQFPVLLHGSSSTDFRHGFVVKHGEMARRAPSNNFFLHAATTVSCILQFAACSSHGRKIVDLYIYEQFGQLLVTVGQFANQIAEFSLLKCFDHDASLASSSALCREAAHCFTNRDLISKRRLSPQCAQPTLITFRS